MNFSFFEKIEQEGQSALSAIEQGASWLVAAVASSSANLHELEESSPLVKQAVFMGTSLATAHGDR